VQNGEHTPNGGEKKKKRKKQAEEEDAAEMPPSKKKDKEKKRAEYMYQLINMVSGNHVCILLKVSCSCFDVLFAFHVNAICRSMNPYLFNGISFVFSDFRVYIKNEISFSK